MTNDEAIKEILFAKRDVLADTNLDKAFDMAIEALKAQNLHDTCTEVAQDTVSRQAAIDAVTKHYRAHDNDLLEVIAYEIEKLPSAEKRTNKRTETHECDLISRQDAIDCVDCGHLRPPTELAWNDLDVVNMLKQLPSAEPERKTGRWIKDKKSSPAKAGLSNYLCDQCGECGGTWRSDLKPHQFPKFCMWCGAKMKMEVEHDER